MILRIRNSTASDRRTALSAAVVVFALVGINATAPAGRSAPPPAAPSADRAPQSATEPKAKGQVDSESKPARDRPTNRLARETSPYLLLHAHNPVDWYPWGDEALAKARDEKKLIFLSIGYASCYWCHVMERESFTDDEVAAFLNKHFVCIKVDREERPDIDHVYMTALSVMGRQGGWPLTMILTPDGKPVFGGTYFPPRDKEIELPKTDAAPAGGKQPVTGLLTLLNLVDKAWEKNPQELRDYAGQVAAAVERNLHKRIAPVPVAKDLPARTIAALAEEFDPKFAGFGFSPNNPRRPKFPEPSNLQFLIDRIERGNDESARRMLDATLARMAQGGIRDHLGGGFHRYSTDRYWRVPHFEKMLYDNAQLATVYSAAYALGGQNEYRRVVEEMLAFVVRELTAPEGGFFAALDAETDGDEGQFYVWTREQLAAALSLDERRTLGLVYGTDGEPNFDGRYVLEIVRPIAEAAAAEQIEAAALAEQLETIRAKLLAVRDRRDRPLTDTKILTAWNGLMIRGFADAGRACENKDYIRIAARGADFVLANLRTPDGRLFRSYAQGAGRLNAYLDDYAFLVDGLLALHRATSDRRWLVAAEQLTDTQIDLFWDDEQGGFYFTSKDHEVLLARSKDPVDSALPSGNAVSAGNLVYLSAAVDRPEYRARAEKTIACFAAMLNESPAAMPRMVVTAGALGDEPKPEKNAPRGSKAATP